MNGQDFESASDVRFRKSSSMACQTDVGDGVDTWNASCEGKISLLLVSFWRSVFRVPAMMIVHGRGRVGRRIARRRGVYKLRMSSELKVPQCVRPGKLV